MERKAYQARDEGERVRESGRFQGRREEYQGPWRDGCGRCELQGGNDRDQCSTHQDFRDLQTKESSDRKRVGERQDTRDVRQMTEEDLRHKIEDRKKNFHQQQNWGSNAGQSSGPPIKCFNYNDFGHHHSSCKKPPFCYSYRESRHKSAQCPLSKPVRGLHLCGYGLPGQLFYALDVLETVQEGKAVVDAPIRALISVLEGRGTKQRVKTELQYLVDSEWNWDVQCISKSEFTATIPSKAVMNLLKNIGKIKFMTADILAVVEETNLDPDVFQVLEFMWVRTVGVPDNART